VPLRRSDIADLPHRRTCVRVDVRRLHSDVADVAGAAASLERSYQLSWDLQLARGSDSDDVQPPTLEPRTPCG
jgi:hypothetical protein